MADEKIDVAGIIGPVLGLYDTEVPDVRSDFKSGRCWQHEARVDGIGRRVWCGKCNAELDPFDVLSKIAHASASRQYRADETRKAGARLEELKAEEKRVKARLKNSMRKDADAAVEAERARSLEARRRCLWKAQEALRLVEDIKKALGRDFDDE